MKRGLLLCVGLALNVAACGDTVTSPDWVTEYQVSPTPGPSPCLLPGRLPRLDRPAPSPDPVTGKCPAPWYN